MYALMHWYGREPRVVLKETLAWDPALGVLLTRLPSRFISAATRRRAATSRPRSASWRSNLDENDAFVIFPEGGNFTPERRERAITRLNRLGLHRMAQRAEEMINVLAPRPGGVLAALDAAPEADVLLVAHTGPRPRGQPRRRLALPADGQAAADGLVADPARGDPARTGRRGSSGCSRGGSASTSGSRSTGRWTCPEGTE